MSEPVPEQDIPAATEPEAPVSTPDGPLATTDLSNPEQHDSAAAEEPAAHAGRLEAELAKVRADVIAGAKAVLRVLPPHSAMTWAGHTVTSEPTEVPASAVPGLTEAAQNAGVELIQEH